MVPVLSTAKSKNDGRHTNDGMIGNLLWRAPELVLCCIAKVQFMRVFLPLSYRSYSAVREEFPSH